MIKILSPEKIERIAYLAQFGKTQSVRTRYTRVLNAEYQRERRALNRRMINLESHGFEYVRAHQLAEAYAPDGSIGAAFRNVKGIEERAFELKKIGAILRDATSLVSYNKVHGIHADDIVRDVLFGDKALYEQERDSATWKDAREFLRFIGGSTVSTYLSLFKDSGDEIEKLYDAYNTDADALKDAFLKWKRYQRNIDGERITTRELADAIDEIYTSHEERKRR